MRRAFVFMFLAPLAVAIAVTMAIVPTTMLNDGFVAFIATVIFLITLPQSIVAGLIDFWLAHQLPAGQRAGLTAAAGAIIPCAVIGIVSHGTVTPSSLLPFAICGAACAGLSALFADGPDLQHSARGFAAALQAAGERTT